MSTTVYTPDVRDASITSAKLENNITIRGRLSITGTELTVPTAQTMLYVNEEISSNRQPRGLGVGKLLVSSAYATDLGKIPSTTASAYIAGDLAVNSKIGVGTNAPSAKIHIVGTSSGDGNFLEGILLENTSASAGESAVLYKNKSTGSSYWFIGLNQSLHYDIAYGTSFSNTNTRIRVQNDGKVGIGNVAPNEALEVTGYVRSSSGYKVGANTVINASRNFTGGTISGSTGTFTGAITWSGGGSANANSAYSHISSDGTSHTYINQDLRTTASPTFTNLYVSGSGKIGVGTTTPNFNLDVNGHARIRSENKLYFGGVGAADTGASIQYNATTKSLSFRFV